jgi:hypothetical protein
MSKDVFVSKTADSTVEDPRFIVVFSDITSEQIGTMGAAFASLARKTSEMLASGSLPQVDAEEISEMCNEAEGLYKTLLAASRNVLNV